MKQVHGLIMGLGALVILSTLAMLWNGGRTREDVANLKLNMDLSAKGIAEIKSQHYIVADSQLWRFKDKPCPPGYACAFVKNESGESTDWFGGKTLCEDGNLHWEGNSYHHLDR